MNLYDCVWHFNLRTGEHFVVFVAFYQEERYTHDHQVRDLLIYQKERYTRDQPRTPFAILESFIILW